MSLNNVFNFSTVETVGKPVKNVENSELQNCAGIDDEISCDYFALMVENWLQTGGIICKNALNVENCPAAGWKMGDFCGKYCARKENMGGWRENKGEGGAPQPPPEPVFG